MARSHIGLLLAVGFLLLPSFASSRTRDIQEDGSGDAPTVQAGIDSAAAGDTVLVFPGIYQEAITFRGKDVVVRSLAGPEQTILDADGFGQRVVTFESGESRAAVLEGLTITGGDGGIIVIDSQPSIIGNRIRGNDKSHPYGDGGGIWCGADTFFPLYPLIQGNEVTGNSAGNLAGGVGAAQWMIPEILDNYIADNEARDGDGGGIYYRSFDNGAVIRGNTVVNNRAGDHGGGIYVGHVGSGEPLEVEVSWNLVVDNYAKGSEITGNSGGGMWFWESNAWVHHNTIVNNTGDGPDSTYGGGIVVEQPGTPVIEQNIIAFSLNGGGIWCGNGATPIIRNNLAWKNLPENGVEDCPLWWQSNSNVVADPYFCDAAGGDYALAQDCPAITHPAGPLGAFPTPGCGPVPTIPATWGQIKARYR
jgi:hypothetical protein